MTHTRTAFRSSTAQERPTLKLKHLSSKAQEDYALVTQAIQGNQRAYTQLTQRYYHSVFHKMLQMVSNREDAHDLTQEAFSKAFHKLPTYAPKFAFSTWLFKIAKNNCIYHIRKKRLVTFSIDDPIEADSAHDYSNNIQAEILDPEEEVIRAQKIDMVQTMVKGLNPKYKSMIQLRFYEEKSYDEIAKTLNIPLGTVKAQLFRAKELLFEQMQQPGPSAYLDSTKRWKKRKEVSAKQKTRKKTSAVKPKHIIEPKRVNLRVRKRQIKMEQVAEPALCMA